MDELTGITVLEADGERLGPFARRQVTAIDEAVAGAGAVLIRGAGAEGVEDFQQALDELGFKPLEY
ncbi:hypothetical protein AB4212_59000, partial [Streptomyces sp. 2MCAF27]